MANSEVLIPIPGRLHSVATAGHVAGADEIYDDTQNKTQETINSEVLEAIGTGGSVDTKIENAINALDATASQSAGADGLALSVTETDGKVTAISGSIASNTYDAYGAASSEATRAQAAESALGGRVTTLETAVGTGGSVDTRIANAIDNALENGAFLGENDGTTPISGFDPVSEVSGLKSRVTAAENDIDGLQAAYRALNQSDVVVVANHTSVSSPVANTIYREQGTNSYIDWMYYNNAWQKMAEYDNAIDGVPTHGSHNLVESGGVEEIVTLLRDFNEAREYTNYGKFIPLQGVSIGSYVDITSFTTNSQFNCIIIPISAGDKIREKGIGAGSPRLWAFLDSQQKLLSVSASDASFSEYHEFDVSEDGYFIASLNTNYAYSVLFAKNELLKDAFSEFKDETEDEIKFLSSGKSSKNIAFSSTSQVVEYDFIKGNTYVIKNTSGVAATIGLTNNPAVSQYNITNTAPGGIYKIIAAEDCMYIRTAQNTSSPTFEITRLTDSFLFEDEKFPLEIADIDSNQSYLAFNRGLGVYVGTDGSIVYNVESCITDLIPYNGGDIQVRGMSGANACLIVYYDENRSVLGYINGLGNREILVQISSASVPVGTKYVRASGVLENGLSSRNNYLNIADCRGCTDSYVGKYTFGALANYKYDPSSIPALDADSRRDLSYWYGLYDDLVENYPDYVSKVDLDTLYAATPDAMEKPSALSDMPLYLYKFIPYYTPKSSSVGVNDSLTNRMKVFIVTGTHPEYMAMYDCYKMMEAICSGWQQEDNLWDMRWNAEFYIMPCSGPWGIVNESRTNYNGVDLNRNAPTNEWVVTAQGTTYSGPSPASEYETKVFVYAFQQIRPEVFIDHHNFWDGQGGGLAYASSINKFVREICAAHIAEMTFRLKVKLAGVMTGINEPPLVGGYTTTAESYNIRSVFANENGALGCTFETDATFNYSEGSISPQTIYDQRACTVALSIFANFVIRLLKEVAQKITPQKNENSESF